MHLMNYFQLNDLEIRKHYNLSQKRLKLGMVSSFDPHSMCAKVERITTKIGCTSCTNWTISFKVRGFQTKIHLFQRPFMCANWTTETVVSHLVQTWLLIASWAVPTEHLHCLMG